MSFSSLVHALNKRPLGQEMVVKLCIHLLHMLSHLWTVVMFYVHGLQDHLKTFWADLAIFSDEVEIQCAERTDRVSSSWDCAG